MKSENNNEKQPSTLGGCLRLIVAAIAIGIALSALFL